MTAGRTDEYPSDHLSFMYGMVSTRSFILGLVSFGGMGMDKLF